LFIPRVPVVVVVYSYYTSLALTSTNYRGNTMFVDIYTMFWRCAMVFISI